MKRFLTRSALMGLLTMLLATPASWTKALCVNQCASAKAQDIVNCSIYGRCA